jgi:hypothetical protein
VIPSLVVFLLTALPRLIYLLAQTRTANVGRIVRRNELSVYMQLFFVCQPIAGEAFLTRQAF